MKLLAVIVVFLAGTIGARADTLWLGTTTTLQDSGFLDVLIPAFEEDTGHQVRVLAQPTGLTLQSAKDGNFDVVMTHAPDLEMAFIDDGFGIERIPFMESLFVVVGPDDDPAGVVDLPAREAMREIYDQRNDEAIAWIARDDDSGTAIQENKIWRELGIENAPEWRIITGQGMGATLNIASAKSVYSFAEIATFLAHENSSTLRVLSQDVDPIFNTYALLRLDPAKFDARRLDLGDAFIDWVAGARAQELIEQFTVSDVRVFTPIASKLR